MLSVDSVQKANPVIGRAMGLAPAAYVLWTRFLKHNPQNPSWPIVIVSSLSAGHGSMLALQHASSYRYDVPLDQIKHFASGTAARPATERGHTPAWRQQPVRSVKASGNGVGMAIAKPIWGSALQSSRIRRRQSLYYAIVSDGD